MWPFILQLPQRTPCCKNDNLRNNTVPTAMAFVDCLSMYCKIYAFFEKAFFFLAKEGAEEGINEPGVKNLAGRK